MERNKGNGLIIIPEETKKQKDIIKMIKKRGSGFFIFRMDVWNKQGPILTENYPEVGNGILKTDNFEKKNFIYTVYLMVNQSNILIKGRYVIKEIIVREKKKVFGI